MSEAFDIYTLLFLVLAVVIFIRLRSVLGRRTGNERPPYDPYTRADTKAGTPEGSVVALPRGRTGRAPVAEASGPSPEDIEERLERYAAKDSAVAQISDRGDARRSRLRSRHSSSTAPRAPMTWSSPPSPRATRRR